jgi:hypothetical protein
MEFNSKISDCFDKTLDLLGAPAKKSFYNQIKKRYNLSEEEFSVRPEEIIDHLSEILGYVGSSVMEKLVIREIRKEFKLDSRTSNNLPVAIGEARIKFLSSSPPF